MNGPIITLMTDFGWDSPYAAAMKGVILSINPAAKVIDLTHGIPPQDVAHGAYFLAEALPWFPAGSMHVAVVDPEVGSERRLLCFDIDGRRLLTPDNGLVTRLERRGLVREARMLVERRYWRADVSATFHGRDILAPVAAHWGLGVPAADFGPIADDWKRLPLAEPVRRGDSIVGEVAFVDSFGNLLSNIPQEMLPKSKAYEVECRGARPRWVRTYADAPPGELVALLSSGGWVEVAMVNGNACRRLDARIGDEVRLRPAAW